MRRMVVKLGLALAAVVLLASACSKSSSTTGGASASISGGGGTITVGSDTANNHGSTDVSGKSSLSVEANDFYFAPTVLTGKAGQSLTLNISNEGSTTHNFSTTASGDDPSNDVQAGSSITVTVKFPQSGILEFYCRFHRAQGMVGELSIS